MGIYIKIEKDKQENEIGYYSVITSDFGGADFYIGIDRQNRQIYIYDSKDLNTLLGSIDCKKQDEPIFSIAEIPVSIVARVVMRAIKSFSMQSFPDFLSFEA